MLVQVVQVHTVLVLYVLCSEYKYSTYLYRYGFFEQNTQYKYSTSTRTRYIRMYLHYYCNLYNKSIRYRYITREGSTGTIRTCTGCTGIYIQYYYTEFLNRTEPGIYVCTCTSTATCTINLSVTVTLLVQVYIYNIYSTSTRDVYRCNLSVTDKCIYIHIYIIFEYVEISILTTST